MYFTTENQVYCPWEFAEVAVEYVQPSVTNMQASKTCEASKLGFPS